MRTRRTSGAGRPARWYALRIALSTWTGLVSARRLGDQQPGRHHDRGGAVRVDRVAGREVRVDPGAEPAELIAQLLQLDRWQAGADAAVAHHPQAVRARGPRRGDQAGAQIGAGADRFGPGQQTVRGGQVRRGEPGGRQGPGGIVGQRGELRVDPEQPRRLHALGHHAAYARIVQTERQAQRSGEQVREPVADPGQGGRRQRGGRPPTDRSHAHAGQQALQHGLLHDPGRRGGDAVQRRTDLPQPPAQPVQVPVLQGAGADEARRPVGAVVLHDPAARGVGDRTDGHGPQRERDAFVAAEVAHVPGVDLVQRRRVRLVAGRFQHQAERVGVIHLAGVQVGVAVERHAAGPAGHSRDGVQVHRGTARWPGWCGHGSTCLG
jgi:hypothetical protein